MPYHRRQYDTFRFEKTQHTLKFYSELLTLRHTEILLTTPDPSCKHCQRQDSELQRTYQHRTVGRALLQFICSQKWGNSQGEPVQDRGRVQRTLQWEKHPLRSSAYHLIDKGTGLCKLLSLVLISLRHSPQAAVNRLEDRDIRGCLQKNAVFLSSWSSCPPKKQPKTHIRKTTSFAWNVEKVWLREGSCPAKVADSRTHGVTLVWTTVLNGGPRDSSVYNPVKSTSCSFYENVTLPPPLHSV